MYSRLFTGEKRAYTTTVTPHLFLGLSPDPEVTEQKTLWCIPFSWENKGKRVYTIGPERRVYTTRPQTRKKKKKEAFHGGGVYFSSSLFQGVTEYGCVYCLGTN